MILVFEDVQSVSSSYGGASSSNGQTSVLACVSLVISFLTFVVPFVWAIYLRKAQRTHSFFDELFKESIMPIFSDEIPSQLDKFDAGLNGILELQEKNAFQDCITKALESIKCLKYIDSSKHKALRDLLLEMDNRVSQANRKTADLRDDLSSLAVRLYAGLKKFY